jgi:DNA-binding transcriptional ArsR family regulator
MSPAPSSSTLRRILANQMRRDAFDIVVNLGLEKGVGFGDICSELGLKRYQTSKLAYHLRILLESGLVEKEMVEGNILYFPTDVGQEAWRASRPVDETQRKVISVLFVQWAVVYAIGLIVACASLLAWVLGDSSIYMFRGISVLSFAKDAPFHLFLTVAISALALCYVSLRGMDVRSEHLHNRSKIFALASPLAFLLVPDVLVVSLLLAASLTLGFSSLPGRDLFLFAFLFANTPFLIMLLAKTVVEGDFLASESIIVIVLLAIPATMISRSRLLISA